jgi:multiple sugar transport system substrate-binding protein
MFLTNSLVKISVVLALTGLFGLSIRGPANTGGDVSMLMEPDGSGTWRDLIDGFQRSNPDITVRLVEGPAATDTREDMYSTSFLSGEASYDIVYCDVVWVPKLAAAGWLLDLTDRLTPADRADFLDADLAGGSYRGRLYRIPAFTDAGVLYYRKDLVSQPPETFDDLERISNELKASDRFGFVWQGKQYEGLVTVFMEVLWGFGGDWIDSESREVFLDRPEALKALEFLKKTVGGISPVAVTTYMEEESRTLFQNGRAIFLRNWPYVWTVMAPSPLRKEGRVGMSSFVHEPGRAAAATLGGWGYAISRFTKSPEAAWKFVAYLTAAEQLRTVQTRLGRIPARKSLVPPEFSDILKGARMRPAIPEYAPASDILQRWVSAAITGRVVPERALTEAARETRLLLER